MAVKQHNTTRWLVCAGAFLLVLMLAAATPRPTWADGGARGPDAPGRLADLGNPTMGDPDEPDDGAAPAQIPPDQPLVADRRTAGFEASIAHASVNVAILRF